MSEVGLYIHIPFCKSKCSYCDFNSYENKDDLVIPYFSSLKSEINLYASKLADKTISTIFIGGGTPSHVDTKFIYEILNICMQKLNVKKNIEISIETNPGTLSFEKLLSYKTIGINRLSIGLQAWQNRLLKKIGRIHNINDFLINLEEARKAGFKNINTDLMFALPGQNLKEWEETIENIISLEIPHVSCYSLKIEEDTPFYDMNEKGELETVDDELDREMYHLAIRKLQAQALKHYEISNFAKPGYECKHNLIYWKSEEYIGLGAGAHSYFEGRRYNNIYYVDEYISIVNKNELPLENIEVIDEEEFMMEYIILRMRLIEGIDKKEFQAKFNKDINSIYGQKLQGLKQKGLIEETGKKIKLSSFGLDLANQVFMEFI